MTGSAKAAEGREGEGAPRASLATGVALATSSVDEPHQPAAFFTTVAWGDATTASAVHEGRGHSSSGARSMNCLLLGFSRCLSAEVQSMSRRQRTCTEK